MKLLVWSALLVAAWALLIGLLAVCARVAGTPAAIYVGIVVAVGGLAMFAVSEWLL